MALEERNGILGKVCTKCKEWKPIERFSPRKASRDGYQSMCKPCNNAPNTTRQPIQIEGKICTVCGEWKPVDEFYSKRYSVDGHRSACKECMQANFKYQRELDINSARAKARNRHARTRTRRIETRRARIAAHLEEHQAYMRKWRAENRERMREIGRRWVARNPEKVREAFRRNYRKYPEQYVARTHRRRALIRAAEGAFTAKEWRDLKALYNHTCLCCGKREPEIQLVPDHVQPLARGGSNDIGNIQPLCRRCNGSKATKSTDYRRGASTPDPEA